MNKLTPPQRIFSAFNYAFLTIFGITMLIPFVHIIAGSFSSSLAIKQGLVSILPVDFTFDNYKAVMADPTIWQSFSVTVLITVVGTFLNLLLTCLMAYALSKHDLKGRSLIMLLVLFTMIFQAPMIPSYLLVKSLGMLNTIWSVIVPGLISAFNMVIMISFFRNIPDGLLDSAKIDGCGEYRTLFQIVMPLSLPSLMTIGLFYAVGHWNSYFNAMMYIRDPNLHPLQLKLRRLIVESDVDSMMASAVATMQSAEGIKMASILFATLPILIVYPLIQKHFVKGSMLGSVKG